MSRNPSDLRPSRNERPGQPGRKPPEPGWRWVIIVVVGLLLATIVLPLFINGHSPKSVTYDAFQGAVSANQVATATINNNNGQISGKLKDGSSYKVTGPNPASGTSTALEVLLAAKDVQISYHVPSSNAFLNLLPIILLLVGMVLIYLWLGRRAQGQM